jgi:hypothetical protein
MSEKTASPDFVLTRELLDGALVPSGYPGKGTQKFFVEGHPEVVVRNNEKVAVSDMRGAAAAYSRLREHGFNVLSMAVVPHNDEAYVITQKVHGRDLIDAVAEQPELVPEVDQFWTRLIDYHAAAYENQDPVAKDIISVAQYVHGHIAGSSEDKIYAVDLSEYSGKRTLDDWEYALDLAQLGSELVKLETAAGQGLTAARAELATAAAKLPANFEYTKALHSLLAKTLSGEASGIDIESYLEGFGDTE